MRAKEKGYEIICVLRDMTHTPSQDRLLASVLQALIKNGAVHADDVWPAEQLIEAFQSVVPEWQPTEEEE
tara:strand:+ start:1235 stop:1444 length:210 start_codon:yes stop_codon:yes gene_type:complete